jgi:hypothetical protein
MTVRTVRSFPMGPLSDVGAMGYQPFALGPTSRQADGRSCTVEEVTVGPLARIVQYPTRLVVAYVTKEAE